MKVALARLSRPSSSCDTCRNSGLCLSVTAPSDLETAIKHTPLKLLIGTLLRSRFCSASTFGSYSFRRLNFLFRDSFCIFFLLVISSKPFTHTAVPFWRLSAMPRLCTTTTPAGNYRSVTNTSLDSYSFELLPCSCLFVKFQLRQVRQGVLLVVGCDRGRSHHRLPVGEGLFSPCLFCPILSVSLPFSSSLLFSLTLFVFVCLYTVLVPSNRIALSLLIILFRIALFVKTRASATSMSSSSCCQQPLIVCPTQTIQHA